MSPLSIFWCFEDWLSAKQLACILCYNSSFFWYSSRLTSPDGCRETPLTSVQDSQKTGTISLYLHNTRKQVGTKTIPGYFTTKHILPKKTITNTSKLPHFMFGANNTRQSSIIKQDRTGNPSSKLQKNRHRLHSSTAPNISHNNQQLEFLPLPQQKPSKKSTFSVLYTHTWEMMHL